MRDRDGQPNPRYNRKLRIDREVDELVGICKGLLADGTVNQSEVEFLAGWLQNNINSAGEWPGNILYDRVRTMLVDGVLDNKEESELLSLLVQVTGGNPSKLSAHSLTSGLPLDDPQPAVELAGRRFCFTGKFLYGSRNACHGEVVSRGGAVSDTISEELNYLVIGVIGSRDWIHSTFGRKIQKAVEYRSKGLPLAIVSEQSFLTSLRLAK